MKPSPTLTMDWWVGVLAIAPGITIAGLVWWLDRYDREPHDLLIGCFLWGALITLPTGIIQIVVSSALSLNMDELFSVLLQAFLIVALVEETAKYLVVRLYVYRRPDFDEPYDGITYTVMAGMGFATTENLLYILGSDAESQLSIALLRMVTAVPSHGANGVLMGYFLGLAKFAHKPGRYHLAAIGIAMLTHGFYDAFLFYRNAGLLVSGAVAVLAISVWLSIRAIRLHQQLSPFRSYK